MLYFLSAILLLSMLASVVESGISCSGSIKHCVRNSASCHIRCKESVKDVFLVPSHQSCKNATNYEISTTPEVFVNTSFTSDSKSLFLLCCDIKKTLICTQTVSICDEPHQVEDHLINCKVKVEDKTNTPKAICHIQQTGTFVANISSPDFNNSCDVDNQTFTCPLNDLNTNHTFHVFSLGEGFCKNISKETKLTFLPRYYVQATNLILLSEKILERSVILRLQLPSGIAHYFSNNSWIYRVSGSITETEIVSGEEVTAEIKNLHPYQQYVFNIDWKYEDTLYWSEVLTIKATTHIDVPETSPSVPGNNYAHGIDVTAIYLQRQPEDSENGPIDEYHISVKTFEKSDKLFKRHLSKLTFSKVFPGDLRTLHLPVNDGQYHTVTISMATAAGVSQHFTTVYISPVSSTVEEKLRTVDWKPLNETHNSVTITDVLNVNKLFVFSCFGIFDADNNLVNCKSDIESKEINSPREPVLIPTPEHEGVNCGECSLHYGAAIQTDNVTSSLLWDSASVPEEKVRAATKEDDTVIQSVYITSFIVLGIFFLIIFIYLYRKWKQFKMPIENPTDVSTNHTLNYTPVADRDFFNVRDFFNDISVISNSLSMSSQDSPPDSPPDSPLESPLENPLTSESSLSDDSSKSGDVLIMVNTDTDFTDGYKTVDSCSSS